MASWHRWFSLLVCGTALATIGFSAGQAIAQTPPISGLGDLLTKSQEETHDQNVPVNYRERGIARLDRGELEGALDDLNQALEDDPADLLARHNRADVYSQMHSGIGLSTMPKSCSTCTPRMDAIFAAAGRSIRGWGNTSLQSPTSPRRFD